MWRSYLVASIRNLQRDKVYASINIGGLALGIACCLLITLWIMQETSYDRFHPSHERLYRVSEELTRADGFQRHRAPSGMPLASIAVGEVGGVASAVRVGKERAVIVANRQPFHEDVLYADSNFFDLFGFTLVLGNPHTALQQSSDIVISEAVAIKYFGRTDVLGQRLTWSEREMFVSGVIAQPRDWSHIKPDIIVPMTAILSRWTQYAQHWDAAVWTYLLLEESVDPETIAGKLAAAARVHFNEPTTSLAYHLMPVAKLHVHSDLGELTPGTSAGTLATYGIAAAILLVLACSNFVMLTVARSSRRVREVGMRKVLGGRRREIVLQFLIESVILATIAVAVALIVVELFAGSFAGVLTTALAVDFASPAVWLTTLGLLLLVGVVAGLYPAIVMARAGATVAIRPKPRADRFFVQRRSPLILAQFALTAVLLMCAAVGYRQLSMMLHADMGFISANTMVVPLADVGPQQGLLLKHEASALAGVTGVSLASNVIGGSDSYGLVYRLAGSSDEVSIPTIWVDQDFPRLFGLLAADGSPVDHPAGARGMLMTESALQRLGKRDAQDVVVEIPEYSGGSSLSVSSPMVLRDFHSRNLYYGKSHQQPRVFIIDSVQAEYLHVRTTPQAFSSGQVSDAMATLWARRNPDVPFVWYVLDEYIVAGYSRDLGFVKTLTYGAFLALLVSCIGLIGLTAYLTAERTKEIGIRKVLGASSTQIIWNFARRFLLVVTLAVIVAWPIAYIVSQRWLQHFPVRAPFDPLVFIGVGAILIATAAVGIGIQAHVAARQNPVEALRYE